VAYAATRQEMDGRPGDEARTELRSAELSRRKLLGEELLGCELLSRELLSCELADRPVTERCAGLCAERRWARVPRAAEAIFRSVAKLAFCRWVQPLPSCELLSCGLLSVSR